MSQILKKIITHCGKNYLLHPKFTSSGELAVQKYIYGPPGELLKKNIVEEWYLSNVFYSKGNILQLSEFGDLASSVEAVVDAFKFVKMFNCSKLPFGMSSIQDENIIGKQDTSFFAMDIPQQSIYFQPKKFTTLRTYLFLHPENSNQEFHIWQEKKKNWWRKLSANPGRYNLTDVKILPKGETVMVQAVFPWGFEIVETMSLRGSQVLEDLDMTSQVEFGVKLGKHVVLPHVMESVIILDRAILVFLCDAFGESIKMTQGKHSSLYLHRRLAPYKVSFSTSVCNIFVEEELCDLAVLLTTQLQRSSILTQPLTKCNEIPLQSQLIRNDELGIPYSVVMSEDTLKDGIIGLRSRDTSLKEMLHISDLTSHIRRLLKNY